MSQSSQTAVTLLELKAQIKRLNSKAGQLKMDLHDVAEGLPADLELLMPLATKTYETYHQLHNLKKELKQRSRES